MTTIKIKIDLKKYQTTIGLVLAVFGAILICLGSYGRVLDNFELDTLDLRFRLRPPIEVTNKVVLIEISEDTIKQLGQFPIERNYHANITKALAEAGAEAIVFDIFFSEPRDYDEEFQDAITVAGNVYLPYVMSIDYERQGSAVAAKGYAAQSLEQFSTFAKGIGHINIIPDQDGKFRRVPLLIPYEQDLKPYIPLLILSNHLDIPFDQIHLEPGKYIQVGSDRKIPLDDQSNIIVNFSGKWGESYKHYSYVDVLRSYIAQFSGEEMILDLNVFKDKICLIGLTAEGTTDLHPSPFEPLYPAVGIHAEVFNSVLNKDFIRRVSRSINLILLLLMVGVIGWAAFKMKPLRAFWVLFGIVVVYIILSILLFIFFGCWIDLFYPVVSLTVVYLAFTLYKYVSEWKQRLLIENELQIAKKIQESFLPKKIPESDEFEIAATMITARQVGGDLYDLLNFGDNKYGVMIGDVTGKGVPASLFMAMAVGGFKFFAKPENKPEETLFHLNKKLVQESTSSLFVTMYYSIFDMNTRNMLYANGGHIPTLYLPKDEKVKFLDVEDGLPLGMLDNDYSGGETKFNVGDIFVYCTDGVTEAVNKQGVMYEKDRLARLLEQNRGRSAEEILLAIKKDVRGFEHKQGDDITFMVIKIKK